jgi:addiction module RelE/StbE family toxin
MKIKWVRLALNDLDEAGKYIAQDNPAAASRVLKRIRDATCLLAEQPHAGRAGRVPGTRELVIAGTPFIIPYRVIGDTVQILRVLHAKRKWPIGFQEKGD